MPSDATSGGICLKNSNALSWGRAMSDANTTGASGDLKINDKPEINDKPAAPLEKPRVYADRLRHRLRNIGAAIASVAAIGAVVGGLTGYWNAWKVINNDVLQIRPHSETAAGLTIS
jgi:hypothetical protein